MVEIQTIIDLLTPLSITAGVIYYVMVLRNQNRTRQAQLIMNLYETYRSTEFRKQQMMIQNLEYTDFNDFWEKYGWPTNPDTWATWFSVAAFFNGVGILIMENMIDLSLVENLLGNITHRMWTLMGPIIVEWRETLAIQPSSAKHELLHGFEHLYNVMYPMENKKR
jgi:hypothetical protein